MQSSVIGEVGYETTEPWNHLVFLVRLVTYINKLVTLLLKMPALLVKTTSKVKVFSFGEGVSLFDVWHFRHRTPINFYLYTLHLNLGQGTTLASPWWTIILKHFCVPLFAASVLMDKFRFPSPWLHWIKSYLTQQ